MAHQNPLHYLLGLEGLALLRAYAGEHDAEFAARRVAEIRRLLADAEALGGGVDAAELSTDEGYRLWSTTYDLPGNGLFGVEEPFVQQLIDELPVGAAVDAACGTGRHTAHLVQRGHRVIGVDRSPEMLARAQVRVPEAEFQLGDLADLPVRDDHADLIVCGLALAHLADLRPAFAEFARVLRPGGHLITTDIHQESVIMGSVPHTRTESGDPVLIPSYRHRASSYLDAALPVGFAVRRCVEPLRHMGDDLTAPMPDELDPQDWDGWPWSFLRLTPTANAAAWHEVRAAMFWHFQRSGTG